MNKDGIKKFAYASILSFFALRLFDFLYDNPIWLDIIFATILMFPIYYSTVDRLIIQEI